MVMPTLDHLRQKFGQDKRVVFKDEVVGNKKVVLVFYQISDNSFWKLPFALETRGHVFDAETGECLSAGFEKFFNINENGFTQLKDLRFAGARYYEKCDGSMCPTMVVDGEVFVRTKKSFYSDVALSASRNLTDKERNVVLLLNDFGYTAIFEYVDPSWQIVLNYGKPQFVLLAARNRITGEYLDFQTLSDIAFTQNVQIIKQYKEVTIDSCLKEVEEITGREGYVIHLASGQRVKLKFRWYLDMHRIHTALRMRDVAEMIIDEKVDDIKSAIIEHDLDVSLIEKIEQQVVSEMIAIQKQVEQEYEYVKEWSFERVAKVYKGSPLSDCIFRKMRGREIDFKQVWKNIYLKQYPLTNIYNENF